MELLISDINSIFVLKSDGFNKRTFTKPRMKESITSRLRGFYIMTKRAEYKRGDLINGCVYLNEVPNIGSRKAEFKCPFCENTFKTFISHIINGHTKSCGCFRIMKTKERSITHGLSNDPLYRLWKRIMLKCYNPNMNTYYKYGGRGIGVYDKWRDDYQLFFNYIKGLDNYELDGYTLDRIENDGDYEPDNLRWTTNSRQMANRRKADSESGFTGVRKMKGNWQVRINVDKQKVHLGTYNKIKDAVKARNDYIMKNDLETYYKIQQI